MSTDHEYYTSDGDTYICKHCGCWPPPDGTDETECPAGLREALDAALAKVERLTTNATAREGVLRRRTDALRGVEREVDRLRAHANAMASDLAEVCDDSCGDHTICWCNCDLDCSARTYMEGGQP